MSFARNKDIPALPDAFVRRIREQFPDDHPAFLSALDQPPRTSIRLNPHKWGRIRHRPEPPGDPVPWSINGRFLSERPSFTLDPLFHAGSYYVQEASSMFLERVLAGPQKTILDACAAPGGKTTLLAALFPDALVVANEVIRSRIPPLLENSIKWGTGNMVVTQNDPDHFSRLPGFFDLILTDAPCSGEGLFRKDTAARREWSPDNAHHCSLRQRSILTGLWPALRPGGLLIYTTCTFNPEENERNIAWLLEQTGGECIRMDAGPAREVTQGAVTGYAFHPHRSAGEGFFLSIIRKPDEMTRHQENNISYESFGPVSQVNYDAHPPELRESSDSGRRSGPSRGKKGSGRGASGRRPSGGPELAAPDPSTLSQTAGWFHGDPFEWYQIGERLFRIRPPHLPLLKQLMPALTVRYAGTEAGRVLRDGVIPAPAAAFDIHLDQNAFPVIEVSTDDALRYLRRENLPVPDKAPGGWHLVVCAGLPLGWTKNVGTRMNNYYPSEWRIRKY
jgi:16S rRNA C967 or C1407 C5-methylase (RsmB/RsmF family)/NOL1/NOP2/fmu family ribosome biogenesis protein